MKFWEKYSDEDLYAAMNRVDKESFPENYEGMRDELKKRGLNPDEKKEVKSGSENDKVDNNPQEVLKELHKIGESKFNPIYLIIISLALFYVIGALGWGTTYLLLLIPIIFIHEFGHLIAMKIFKYRNTKILFVPLMGGLASGIPSEFNWKKEAIIALMGPAIGTIGGVLFYCGYIIFDSDIFYKLTIYSLIINGLNLIPISPLDGGKVAESIIFSRHIYLEIGFKVIAFLLVAIFGIYWRDWILLILGYALAVRIYHLINEYQILSKAKEKIPSRLEEFSVELVGNLSSLFEKRKIREDSFKPKEMANFIHSIFLRKNQKYPNLTESILISLVYIGLIIGIGAIGIYIYMHKNNLSI